MSRRVFKPKRQEDFDLHRDPIKTGSTADGWVLLGSVSLLGIFIVYSLFTRS